VGFQSLSSVPQATECKVCAYGCVIGAISLRSITLHTGRARASTFPRMEGVAFNAKRSND